MTGGGGFRDLGGYEPFGRLWLSNDSTADDAQRSVEGRGGAGAGAVASDEVSGDVLIVQKSDGTSFDILFFL